MLLIDDHKLKVTKSERILDQRMSAYHELYHSRFELLFDPLFLRGGDRAGKKSHLYT